MAPWLRDGRETAGQRRKIVAEGVWSPQASSMLNTAVNLHRHLSHASPPSPLQPAPISSLWLGGPRLPSTLGQIQLALQLEVAAAAPVINTYDMDLRTSILRDFR
uniref:Uncharacterized protein n=2 Tax=Oryza sativa subsp. japonica TaxID=39947 RepID=Q8W388_ORYSJ|nr:hypothetical protein [Oryza sativa Japonica Group]ABF96243.1 hypothetical protein LOC_Os03g26120 [Oryza sativa Japonica Group]